MEKDGAPKDLVFSTDKTPHFRGSLDLLTDKHPT